MLDVHDDGDEKDDADALQGRRRGRVAVSATAPRPHPRFRRPHRTRRAEGAAITEPGLPGGLWGGARQQNGLRRRPVDPAAQIVTPPAGGCARRQLRKTADMAIVRDSLPVVASVS